MKKFLLLSVIALVLAGSTEVFAQNRDRNDRGRYNNRQDRQRVRRGIRSGQLTRAEAREIRERQQRIRAARRGYRSDGVITRNERRQIRRGERVQDRYVREQRRDDDRRPRYDNRNNRRRGHGYYSRGAGSPTHPVFGRRNRRN